jgi:N-acetylglucosaminyl-diphospho-decaprenol L-rhamnosyltransferase
VPTNLGFAAGINLGVRNARGDLIGLLNDDAVAGPGWLVTAGKVLEDQHVAAVTPKVLLAATFADIPDGARPHAVRVAGKDVTANVFEGPGRLYVPIDGEGTEVLLDGEQVEPQRTVRLLNHAGMYLHRHGYAGDYGLGAPDDGRFDAPAERFGCSGAAPVFRAETLARIGGFEERFFAYNEDVDWCFRARLAGLRFEYDPSATVTHRMSATSGGDRSLATQLLTRRNQLLTLVRNAPVPVAAEHLTRATLSPHRHGVRRAVARRLPWAIASRRQLRQKWVRTPEEVWREWAGVDNEWDTPPSAGFRST